VVKGKGSLIESFTFLGLRNGGETAHPPPPGGGGVGVKTFGQAFLTLARKYASVERKHGVCK